MPRVPSFKIQDLTPNTQVKDGAFVYNPKMTSGFPAQMKALPCMIIQRAAGALVLFAALLVQVQVVYACAHMDLPAQKDCCCEQENARPCPMEMDPGTHCCETRLVLDQDPAFTMAAVPVQSDSPSHPDKPLPHGISVYQEAESQVVPVPGRPPDTFWDHRSDTYLVTLRFRE